MSLTNQISAKEYLLNADVAIQSLRDNQPLSLILDTDLDNAQAIKLSILSKNYSPLTLILSLSSPSVIEAPFNGNILPLFSHATVLIIRYAWKLASLSFLETYTKLLRLEIQAGIKTNSLDLGILTALVNLQVLYIEKQKRVEEVLPKLIFLRQIGLNAVDLQDVAFSSAYSNLEEMFLKKVSLTNIYGVNQKLKHLTLADNQHLMDIGDVSHLKNLEQLALTNLKVNQLPKLGRVTCLKSLALDNLKAISDLSEIRYAESLRILALSRLDKVSELPDLSRLTKLSRIYLRKMSGLRNLTPLLKARSLTQLYVEDAAHMMPDDFKILSGHPSLRQGAIRLNSKKKNLLVKEILPLESSSQELE